MKKGDEGDEEEVIWGAQGDLDVWFEDKLAYCNANNEMVKIFSQNCVLCFEKLNALAFHQCGHRCMCENCYEKR